MMKKAYKKLRVAVLCGGRSTEHEVSLRSARNVMKFLDKDKYEVVAIGIDHRGRWQRLDIQRFIAQDATYFENAAQASARLKKIPEDTNLALMPDGSSTRWITAQHPEENLSHIDVIIPMLHGTYGEDGSMQGLLKIANLPFVGTDVLGSALGMDKDITKRLLRDAGLPITDFLVYRHTERDKLYYEDIVEKLGIPFFVKPANLGSSIGIHKVHHLDEFLPALDDAFSCDNKILFERFIEGREFECGVIGNDGHREATLPGELLPQYEFYSYHAKYLDEKGALFEIPAKLPHPLLKQFQALAIRAADVLCCEGMVRVDFFMTPNEKLYINEVNTIPGFTDTSMFPMMWQASGLSFPALLDRLIELAIARFERDKKLRIQAGKELGNTQ